MLDWKLVERYHVNDTSRPLVIPIERPLDRRSFQWDRQTRIQQPTNFNNHNLVHSADKFLPKLKIQDFIANLFLPCTYSHILCELFPKKNSCVVQQNICSDLYVKNHSIKSNWQGHTLMGFGINVLWSILQLFLDLTFRRHTENSLMLCVKIYIGKSSNITIWPRPYIPGLSAPKRRCCFFI